MSCGFAAVKVRHVCGNARVVTTAAAGPNTVIMPLMTRPAACSSIETGRKQLFAHIACVLISLQVFAGCTRSDADGPAGQDGTLRIAVAANLQFAFEDIIAEFQRQHPSIRIDATYGSSGNFHAQLSNRAPFDMFFAADVEYPQRLVDAGSASADGMFEYARGRIAIWVANDALIDLESLGMRSIVHESVRRIAIANPQHAPYGRAAVEAMRHAGIHEQSADRLVLGENVAQAAQFIESGAADIGIIALSLAYAPLMKDKGRIWVVPAEIHADLRQAAVILAWCRRLDAAADLRAFVLGPSGQVILDRYGFASPGV